MSRTASPYLLLTLTNLFWAGNWIVGRGMRAEVPPVALSYWRWVIAFLLFLPIAWPQLRASWPALRAHWRRVLPFGLLGAAPYNALSYLGLQHTTATNGLLLNSFTPIVIVALAWVVHRKRLTRLETIGVTLSFVGVLAIVARGEPATLLALSLNAGDLWVLVAVLSWALYTLLLPHRPAGIQPLAFLCAAAAVGLAVLTPFYAWELAAGRHLAPTPAAFATIAYAGIFPAFLGYIFWNKGVEAVGAARAGLFMHLMPAFGIVLAALFLDERLAAYHLAGIVLIFGGIVLTTRRP